MHRVRVCIQGNRTSQQHLDPVDGTIPRGDAGDEFPRMRDVERPACAINVVYVMLVDGSGRGPIPPDWKARFQFSGPVGGAGYRSGP